MPKGVRNESSHEQAIREFYGGIRLQVIFFAAEVGISAERVAERVSALLSPERERLLHHLSSMQRAASGVRPPVEPLALAQHAHSSEAPPTIEAVRSTSHKKSRKGVNSEAAKGYWANMTPEERKAESARRRRKWSPEAKAKWHGSRSGRRTAKGKKRSVDAAKQSIYLARAKAKKAGLPIPPLPGESASVQ